jgi:hypothetical protein
VQVILVVESKNLPPPYVERARRFVIHRKNLNWMFVFLEEFLKEYHEWIGRLETEVN